MLFDGFRSELKLEKNIKPDTTNRKINSLEKRPLDLGCFTVLARLLSVLGPLHVADVPVAVLGLNPFFLLQEAVRFFLPMELHQFSEILHFPLLAGLLCLEDALADTVQVPLISLPSEDKTVPG